MAKEKVLVANKEKKTALQLKERLSRMGYAITGIVSDTKPLFKNIEKKKPDLVLLDVGIEDARDAIETASVIQSNFGIPVVLLAPRADDELMDRAAIAGPLEVVVKPFRREELYAAIELSMYKKKLSGQTDPLRLTVGERDPCESLQKSIERFSTSFHSNPSGMVITRFSDGRIIESNSSYQRLFGFTPDELIGNTSLSLGIQRNTTERNDLLNRLEQDGFVRDFETTLRTKSGNLVHVLTSLELIELDGEQCILASVYDITERKRAEEALRTRERFLALLNDMTQTVLLSNDFYSIVNKLAVDMAKLLNADGCYITRWDSALNKAILVATAPKSEQRISKIESALDEINLTTTIFQAGHPLALDDVLNSPDIKPYKLEELPFSSMLGIPLVAVNQKLGAAFITFSSPHRFTPEEINQAAQAGNQVAIALWNFQQSTEIRQRLKQSHALTDIGRALSEIQHRGLDRVLQLIVDSALDLIYTAEKAIIHIVDLEQKILHPMAIAGFAEKSTDVLRINMQLGKGVAGQVIQDGITINVSNVDEDPRFLRSHGEPGFRSLMVAPIQSDRQQIGTISIHSKVTNAFSADDEQLLNALAIDASIAIENTRSFEATQQRLKEVNSLYGTIKGLAASLDPEELATSLVDQLQKNFGFYFVQLFMLDPFSGELVLKAGSGEGGKILLQDEFRMPRGSGIAGHVAETGVPFITKNINDVVFFQRNPLLPDTLFELAVPIKIGKNVVGVLDIQDKPPKQFTDSDLQLVQAVGDQLAVAWHKANLYTDLQEAMQQEQDIRSQLIQSERLALVGRLLASVSHELNNPLQAIQNALFLLKEESDLSPQGRQDLGIVLSETERMAALIERLRSAYRPIRGKDFQPVQLNNLIEDVYALIGTHMRHKDIAFEFIPDPELHPVSGISDQLRQVVLNLFLNAVEVMQPGGRLTVQTRNLFDGNEVYFSVKDTGPGIDIEILPRIFDAFITSKHTGTGLGLTITHDILQQHRARISAENDPLGGAIFQVWLPMCEKE